MERYIVRIYRRQANKVVDLLTNTSNSEEQILHSLQQLGQYLDLSGASGGREACQPRQNLNNT